MPSVIVAVDGYATIGVKTGVRAQRVGGAGGVLFGVGNFVATNLFVLSVRIFGLKPPVADNTAQSYEYLHLMVPVSIPLALTLSGAGLLALLFVRALDERLRLSSPALSPVAAFCGYVGLVTFQVGLMSYFYIQQRIVSGADQKAVENLLPSHFVIDAVAGLVTTIFLGLWIFLVSWIATTRGGLPRILNYLGFFAAVALVIAEFPLISSNGIPGRGMLFASIWLAWAGAVVWLRPQILAVNLESQGQRV